MRTREDLELAVGTEAGRKNADVEKLLVLEEIRDELKKLNAAR